MTVEEWKQKNPPIQRKPPIGAKPSWLCSAQRIAELAAAINRYAEDGHGDSRRILIRGWAEEIILQCDIWAKVEEAEEWRVMNDFAIVFYSDRLEIERAFNEWADKNGVAKVPNALVAFLEINGLLNEGKTIKWCRARRQKKKTEEGE